jgi:predicted permease
VPSTHQLRLAVRKLLKTPVFSAIALGTLALGIGANSTIFSVVEGVLLRPLPYPESDRVVMLWHTAPGLDLEQFEQSNTTYTLYRAEHQSFVDVGLTNEFALNLTGTGDPSRIGAGSATSPAFRVLGATPILGRLFSPEDDVWGSPDVVILGEELWRSRFGADARVLGQLIELDGTSYEIVGVLPATFDYPSEDVEVWLQHRFDPATLGNANFSFEAVARLKEGVTYEAAAADLNRILATLPDAYPGQINRGIMEEARMAAFVEPLDEAIIGDIANALWILLGTVGFVLLIATANVANLFLVRAEARQKEIAVRTALGAGRRDIITQYLSESVLLGLAGGVGGLVLAAIGTRVLVGMTPFDIPRLAGAGLNATVLGYTLGISVLAGLFFGAVPILKYGMPNLVTALKEGGRASSSGRETHRARNLLVVSQVALALVLLVGSGLLARSYWQLRNVDPGFVGDGLMTFRVSLPESSYPDGPAVARFHQILGERLASIPGVESVGTINSFPMTGNNSNQAVLAEDHPPAQDELPTLVRSKWVGPGFFETAGVAILEGRSIERSDLENRTGSVVVSRSFADQEWPDGTALGRRIANGIDTEERTNWSTIVGIAADVRDDGVAEDASTIVYWPQVSIDTGQLASRQGTMTVVMRTSVEPTSVMPAARQEVWGLNAELPIAAVRTGADVLRADTARSSFTMLLLGLAAAVALVLGTVGIYGVVSYVVSQRTREIGVRMALGARQGQVSLMVLKQGLSVVLVGVLVGMAGALALTRLLATMLFGVAPTDPLTFASVGLMLTGVASAACFFPARRAARVQPMEALHYE